MANTWQDLTAVVLAGGDADDPLAAAFGVPAKALTPIAGKPMASYVLKVLGASPQVERVVYVGPAESLPVRPETVVAAGERFSESVERGLEAARNLEPEAPLLLLSADIPWLRPEGLERFLMSAPEADLVYPAIPRTVAERQFPGQRRTYAKLREGEFTGGNLVLLRPRLAPRLLELLERAYQARKNPLALAGMVGADMLFKLLLGRATLPELEARVGRLLGASARAFVSDDASLGADVDRPEHLGQGPPLPRD